MGVRVAFDIRRVAELLQQSTSVADVAVTCGLSVRKLTAAVKSALGRPPEAFLVRVTTPKTCGVCGRLLPRSRYYGTHCRRCQQRKSVTRMPGSRVPEHRIPVHGDCLRTRAEVAELLGISETRVEEIEQDALQKLRDGLLARGVGPETLRELVGREQGWVFE